MKHAKSITKEQAITFYFWAATVLAVASCITLALCYQFSHQASTSPSSFKGIPFGKTVTNGSAAVSITSVSTSPGTSHFTAPKDYTYEIVEILIKNTTDKPILVQPSTDSYLKTDAGKVVYLTPYELDTPLRSGSLLPGESIKGQLSYLVKTGETYKLYLESDWTGGVLSFLLH